MLRNLIVQTVMLAGVFCLTTVLVFARDALAGHPDQLVSTDYVQQSTPANNNY